jgi:hypothetical protein
MYILRDWVDPAKLSWPFLSGNVCAFDFLKDHPEKINWVLFVRNEDPRCADILFKNQHSENWPVITHPAYIWRYGLPLNPYNLTREIISADPRSVYTLKENPSYIEWSYLSMNPSPEAVELLKAHPEKIDWRNLSKNPCQEAIRMLERYPHRISWYCLSSNPCDEAIELLKRYPHNINWHELSGNTHPEAIRMLKENRDKINWFELSGNSSAGEMLEHEWLFGNPANLDWHSMSYNPGVIALLEKNQDKIFWDMLSMNPAIFTLNYDYFKERCDIYREELIQRAMHPRKIERYLDAGYDLEEILDCFM